MKNSLFSRIKLSALAVFALLGAVCSRAIERVAPSPLQFSRQGGFVLLNRSYQGYAAGTVVELSASTEAALIASGQATASAGPPTPGPVTTTATSGCVAIPAGSSSVVITNPLISPQSQVFAAISQAAGDATLTFIMRIIPANGSVTITGSAAATAATSVDWAILNPNGSFTSPQ